MLRISLLLTLDLITCNYLCMLCVEIHYKRRRYFSSDIRMEKGLCLKYVITMFMFCYKKSLKTPKG